MIKDIKENLSTKIDKDLVAFLLEYYIKLKQNFFSANMSHVS